MRLSNLSKPERVPTLFSECCESHSVYLSRFDEDAGTCTPFTFCCFLFVFLTLTVFERILFGLCQGNYGSSVAVPPCQTYKTLRVCNSLPRWSQDAENNLPPVFSVPFVTIHNAINLWTGRIIKTVGVKAAASSSLFRDINFPLSLIQLQTSFLWTHRYYDRNTPNTRNDLTTRFSDGAFQKQKNRPFHGEP